MEKTPPISRDQPYRPHYHLPPLAGLVRWHILVNRSSVELFANDGQVFFTEQIFPAGDSRRVELFVQNGQIQLNRLDIYKRQPARIKENVL